MLPLSRRGAVRSAALAAALSLSGVLAACSTGSTTETSTGTAATEPSTAASDAFPVTVEHAYGETTVASEPTRVATVGWGDQDTVLSLGVVPVGSVDVTWGGNERGSTPWFDEKLAELGGEQPARYSDADGVPIEEIAQTQPDLIIATATGITEAEYAKLSRLAPTVAFPDAPWTTSWQEGLSLIGQALGRTEEAAAVKAETEESIAAAREAHPQLEGKSFIFGSISTADTSKVDYYMPDDNRPRILTELGMVNAPVVERLSEPGQFYGTVSAERAADLESDVFITYGAKKSDLTAFQDDPLLGRIPGVASGHVLVSLDQTASLGMSGPSPLSVPYAMEEFVPALADAVDGTPTVG